MRREYLGRVKAAFDERGIEIPFPHLTVYAGMGKDGHAPALRLLLADDAIRRAAREGSSASAGLRGMAFGRPSS